MNTTPYSTPTVDPFGRHAQVQETGSRGPRIGLGIVIALIGIITGVVLWFVAAQRYDDGVASLARAPVGCDTTLDFSSAGEYLVFVETAGSLPEVRGDCGAGGAFDLGDVSTPVVDVSIVDPDGNDVPLLSRIDRESYDRSDSVGSSIALIQVDTPGDHVVRVESASNDTFAVAIGEDPSGGVGALRLVAALAAAIGIGVGLIVALTRRTTRVPPALPRRVAIDRVVVVAGDTSGRAAHRSAAPGSTGCSGATGLVARPANRAASSHAHASGAADITGCVASERPSGLAPTAATTTAATTTPATTTPATTFAAAATAAAAWGVTVERRELADTARRGGWRHVEHAAAPR